MNWRRGLLLAAVNVGIALPMIAILAARDGQMRRDRNHHSKSAGGLWIDSSGAIAEAPTKATRAPEEEQTVTFSPCGLWESVPVQQSVVQSGNLPASLVTQWRTACPPRWSLARMLGVNDTWLLSDVNFSAMRRVDVALCLMIALQWLLIGGLPLVERKRWWSEPGAFITLCTAIASGIALFPAVDVFGRLPVLFAVFGWLYWFFLLFWKPVRPAWQSTLHGLRRLSN